MPETSARTFDQKLNTWVQTIGIIAAAVWGVFIFWQKEIMAPMSAPVNITVNLQLKRSGENVRSMKVSQARLIAVEMRVSATNPSSRTVYLLPSVWTVHGHKIVARRNKQSYSEEAVAALKEDTQSISQRHATVESSSLVSAGRLFRDDFLRPGETTSVTLVFHIPPREYDELEALVQIASVERPSEVVAEWKVDENEDVTRELYRVDGSGNHTQITDPPDPALGFQQAESRVQLSLWH